MLFVRKIIYSTVKTSQILLRHSLAHPCFLLIFIIHSILYCTFYLIAHPTLFILLFVPFFILTYIYIYILLCYVSLLMLFLFSILLFFCTFHWADLSRPTFHYWLYPVWLCMWQIIKNLEPNEVIWKRRCFVHFKNEKLNCSKSRSRDRHVKIRWCYTYLLTLLPRFSSKPLTLLHPTFRPGMWSISSYITVIFCFWPDNMHVILLWNVSGNSDCNPFLSPLILRGAGLSLRALP